MFKVSMVMHSSPLDYLVHISTTQEKLTPVANIPHLVCQGFKWSCWKLVPISDNHEEMVREGKFPESSDPNMLSPSE